MHPATTGTFALEQRQHILEAMRYERSCQIRINVYLCFNLRATWELAIISVTVQNFVTAL